MGTFSHWHWLVVLLVVVLIFVLPRLKDHSGKPLDAAGHPVFSSISVEGKEAEHIDEKLPKRWGRFALYTLAFVMLASAMWLVTRP